MLIIAYFDYVNNVAMSITLKLSIGVFVVSQLITSADILFQLVNKLSSESKEVYKIIHVVGNHVRHKVMNFA